MCGRFALSITAAQFRLSFGCAPPEMPMERYNVTPDASIAVVRLGQTGREAVLMRWGLIPPWSKDPADPARQINARSETFLEKRMFKDAGRHRRCLVPASGFYEWQKTGGETQPWWIGREDDAPLAFAGIWQPGRPEAGIAPSCAILTTQAYDMIADIHHRMPVMLDAACHDSWLDPALQEPSAIALMLRPIDEALIAAWPVSRAVNSPANDDSSLRRRAEPEPAAQGSLF